MLDESTGCRGERPLRETGTRYAHNVEVLVGFADGGSKSMYVCLRSLSMMK